MHRIEIWLSKLSDLYFEGFGIVTTWIGLVAVSLKLGYCERAKLDGSEVGANKYQPRENMATWK